MKQKVKHVLCFLIVLTVLGLDAFSQQGAYVTVRDLEFWSSAELKYAVNKKWKLGLEEQLRLKSSASDVDQYFTEFNVKNKFSKSMFWGLGLRYIRENDTEGNVQGYEKHFRFNLDLGFKHEIKRFDMVYRLRYQNKNELGISREDGDIANKHMRLKISSSYNIKKWKLDPEISVEIFNELGKEKNFDKVRFTASTAYKIKKFGTIGVFYRMERELNKSYPKITHIPGIKYTYTLKRNKKDE
jgi:hypothetical protein